jgi:hypothetical protein
MKKWTKRISLAGLTLLVIVVVLGVQGWWLVRGTPDWYLPQALTPEQREAAAQSATDKLILIQNQAARARMDGNRNQAAAEAGAISISFSENEINALLEKWSAWGNFKATYERFISDPRLVLKDGRIILAGRVKELGAVASLHFDPQIDQDGRLKIKLARILAGKLPLPHAIVSRYQQQGIDAIKAHLPAWRRNARIDSTGLANGDAISAGMGLLLVDVLRQKSAEPILFLRLVESGSIPVKLSEVKIDGHDLTLVVRPMTPQQRDQLLRQIRDGDAAEGDSNERAEPPGAE